MTVWYQVEFYSDIEHRWVPLFAKEETEAGAWRKAHELLETEKKRVVKVTQTTEVMGQKQCGLIKCG